MVLLNEGLWADFKASDVSVTVEDVDVLEGWDTD